MQRDGQGKHRLKVLCYGVYMRAVKKCRPCPNRLLVNLILSCCMSCSTVKAGTPNRKSFLS
eukprot:5290360-Amphidinium_carterae.2